MPQSPQERLVRSLSMHSMGAPFVFEPDPYRKGRGAREPFDLAWACNKCLIMINMTRGNKSGPQKLRHNMKALKGWLRVWSDEVPLRGSSVSQSFEIRPGDYPHLVLISLVGGRDSTAEFHSSLIESNDLLRSKGVVFAATVPEEALIRLADLGGSTRDLLTFLNLLRIERRALPETRAVAVIEALHRSAFVRAAGKTPGLDVDPDLMDLIVQSMLSIRAAQIQKTDGHAHVDGDAYTVLNDLDWEGLLVLLRHSYAALAPIAQTAPGSFGPLTAVNEVTIEPYTFMIDAVNSIAAGHAMDLTPRIDEWRERSRTAHTYPPISLMYSLDSYWLGGGIQAMYTVHRRRGASLTEKALAQWKIDQDL